MSRVDVRPLLLGLRRRRRLLLAGVGLLVAAWLGLWLYHAHKALPPGVAFAGGRHRGEVEFLFDATYRRDGAPVVEQRIFDRVLAMIDSAQRFVVMDMFLFNDEHAGDRDYRPLTRQLTDRLLARKSSTPALEITLLTDPINTFYGAYGVPQLDRLRDAGVTVITTRLSRLRDSNPSYSAAWRLLAQWLGTGGWGWIPHPLSSRGQRVTLRSYLALLNFKANHRKLIVTEAGCLVTSANPHDASGLHSNIAFRAGGPICGEMLEVERGTAAFSGGDIAPQELDPVDRGGDGVATESQYLTEGRIRQALLEELAGMESGGRIDVAVFYLSERSIVEALIAAAARGIEIRVILDPNRDAFGRQKGGVPNRQVAWELRARSGGRIAVRWYDTHGEQFHTKLAVFRRGDRVTVIGGSANFTRRNLGNFNLEADLRVWADAEGGFARAVQAYFERLWSNQGGHFTVDFQAYRDDAWWKRVLYRVEEFTGWCTY